MENILSVYFIADSNSGLWLDLITLGWSVDRELAKKRSVELVCQVYSQVYTALTAPGTGYTEILSLMPRTPDQVIKLLC